ncbi:MAG: gamma-glutamylcyclotransferase [Cyanobium sp.]
MDLGDGLLFVYGSLKRGQANHHHLADAPFEGEAVIGGVQLHDLGPFPMAIPGEGRIHGELYRVDAGRLALLDRFEGVPRLYERRILPLSDGRGAWIYLGGARQVRHSPRLPTGRWPADCRDDGRMAPDP